MVPLTAGGAQFKAPLYNLICRREAASLRGSSCDWVAISLRCHGLDEAREDRRGTRTRDWRGAGVTSIQPGVGGLGRETGGSYK
ncbi:hypothetical protein VZT92_027293 [Zoarces viviparus]|uniref:Uncharacterized protein n=1 Tax=Zoarces viviparus TaxID=48416 RepID=A0AAW1DUE3_ZOAVI